MNSRHRMIGALVGAALLLSACGGSSSTSTPAPSTLAVSTPATSALAVSTPATSAPASAASSPEAPGAALASGASDACALATVGDVMAAFGGKIAAGTANAAHSECKWHVVGAGFGSDCDVTVAIPAFPDDKTSFDQNKAQGGGATTVPGVGDDAYHPEQGNPSLQFRKGNSVAEVDLECTTDPDDAKESAAVATLAKSVVAKL